MVNLQFFNQLELKEKTAQGLLWGFISNGSMQILNVVFGVVLTFLLSSDDYGMMAVLSIYSAIAASLQDSGFVAALTNRPHPTHRDYNSVFWFNITCSALIYTILWFCAPLIADYNHDPRLIPLSRYAFLGFLVASFSITPRAILFKQMRVREQTIINLVALIVSGLAGITIAVSGLAYWSIATQSIVFVGTTAIMSWHYTHWRPSLKVSIQPICQMLPFSFKLLITNVFFNINKYAFESLLGHYYPKSSIGYYSQANKWNLMGSQTISGMVQGVAQPMFVEVGDDPCRLRRAFLKMLQFTSLVAFPALFGLSLVSHEVISLLPARWLPAADYLQLLALGGAFLPIATLYSNFIISRGKSRVYMWNTIIQSLLLLLIIYSVQHFQLVVCGVSGLWLMLGLYVLVQVLWLAVWHIFLWRDIRLGALPAVKVTLPLLLIALFTMVVTYFVTLPITCIPLLLIVRIAVAALIYVGMLRLFYRDIIVECINFLRRKNHPNSIMP